MQSTPALEMSRVPMPAPVPPPSEWQSWKPWRQSQPAEDEAQQRGPNAVARLQLLVYQEGTVNKNQATSTQAMGVKSSPSASLRTTSSTESMSSAPLRVCLDGRKHPQLYIGSFCTLTANTKQALVSKTKPQKLRQTCAQSQVGTSV